MIASLLTIRISLKRNRYLLVISHLKLASISTDVALVSPIGKKNSLEIKLPFQCWKIKDKKIDDIPIMGETISINGHEIEAKISSSLKPFTDLKIRINFCMDAHCFEDIYAKTISSKGERKRDQKLLRITSMEQKDRDLLKKWMEQGAN